MNGAEPRSRSPSAPFAQADWPTGSRGSELGSPFLGSSHRGSEARSAPGSPATKLPLHNASLVRAPWRARAQPLAGGLARARPVPSRAGARAPREATRPLARACVRARVRPLPSRRSTVLQLKSIFNLTNTSIGAGVLALPYFYSTTGTVRRHAHARQSRSPAPRARSRASADGCLLQAFGSAVMLSVAAMSAFSLELLVRPSSLPRPLLPEGC